ncbi:MAG TPA: histidine kinase dimerization/phospho-acceptor domain-containing protein [Thermoanaerobaculia bacterium]|jgi:signal transduction histidine kinase|nr:histidine kinase dimerization/phospho-acceptor domain-containing protein [Thermoanaerobaculia bacterium]
MSELATDLVDAMPVALVAVGPRWEVKLLNRAAVELLGVAAAASIGRSFAELALVEGESEATSSRLEAAHRNAPLAITCRLGGGQTARVEVTVLSLPSREGDRLLLLRPTAERADQHSPARNGLPADAASHLRHDISNPLNALLGFAILLRNGQAGPLPLLAEEMVDDIVTAAQEVQALVDSILSTATMERSP